MKSRKQSFVNASTSSDTLTLGCFALVIALVVGSMGVSCYRNVTGASSRKATDEFKQWTANQYPSSRFELIGMECNSIDSDGDGYVSCSGTIEDKETKKIERLSVECSSGILNGGCREQRIGGFRR